jgi:hypothetical protein
MIAESHTDFDPVNPFAKRDEHATKAVWTYKALTIITWLLVVITSIYYTFNAPGDDKYPRRTIWGQNRVHHTAFALNSVIASIYWYVPSHKSAVDGRFASLGCPN